jgi:hypothetical protein
VTRRHALVITHLPTCHRVRPTAINRESAERHKEILEKSEKSVTLEESPVSAGSAKLQEKPDKLEEKPIKSELPEIVNIATMKDALPLPEDIKKALGVSRDTIIQSLKERDGAGPDLKVRFISDTQYLIS